MGAQITPDSVSDSILLDLYSEVENRGEHYLLSEDRKMSDSEFASLLYSQQQSNISLYRSLGNKSSNLKLMRIKKL